MKKVIVRAPVRADLAGGTLDLWPIYLFHPGARTVNVAISFYAESEVCETGDSAIEIHLTDQQYRQRYETLHDLAADPKAALIYRALEHFHLTGLQITTRTDAPRGSGLGGSSALTVTLVRALSEFAGTPIEGDDLLFLVRDLETRLLGVPAGIQDYYPPVYGGLAAIHLEPGVPVRRAIPVSIGDFGEHFVLHYSGIAHFSGTNNWEMYKRQVEGKKKVQRGFAKIAETAIEMERALEAGNWPAAGKALAAEWENRKALIDGISTPEIDAAIAAATAAGAWGGKVCGAGGGGCIVFLTPPAQRDAVVRALAAVPGRVRDAAPGAHGMTVTRDDESQAAFSFSRGRLSARAISDSIEQLYVSGGSGAYRPFLLGECVIALTEPRSGLHHTIVRAYIAPINGNDGRVDWSLASLIDPETLDIRAVPDPDRKTDVAVSAEALVQNAVQSQEAFRQFVGQRERLRIFQNATFGLWSSPEETRETFLARCREEAARRVEEHAERLEGTFRRRIDQVKERSQRDQREAEAKDEVGREEEKETSAVAWGQALYNITSGRPAAVADLPQTPRDSEYLEKIAQIQRAWDRELETLREEMEEKAREIEEVEVVASPRNIEVSKFLILWAANLG
jgi:D-glycero-alpha-D-manno-heptose-7-phosphate kinase